MSGYMLESSLEAGLNSAGVDVMLTGPLPTPGVAYLTRALRLDLGVVIQRLAQPLRRQRHQVLLRQGREAARCLGDPVEADSSASRSGSTRWPGACAPAAGMTPPGATSSPASRPRTSCRLKRPEDRRRRRARRGLPDRAPDVFHELGAEVVHRLQPDGSTSTTGVGATHPRTLLAAVRAHSADYGIALDGDADRLQMVDATAASTTATSCCT